MKLRFVLQNNAGVAAVTNAIAEIFAAGKRAEIEVGVWTPKKTDAQRRTIWKWHGEVASQLAELGKAMGHGARWTKDDVHDVVFKPRFMPSKEIIWPDGTVETVPKGLSDPTVTRQDVTDAMTKYLAWIYERGFEVTIPPDPLLETALRCGAERVSVGTQVYAAPRSTSTRGNPNG